VGKSLNIGYKEAKRPNRSTYDWALMADDGIYAQGHAALDRLISNLTLDSQERTQIRNRFRLRAVHECEEAKLWLDLQSTEGDFHSVRIAENDKRAADCRDAIEAISKLIQLDNSSPYFLRQAFSQGLAVTVEREPKDLDAWWPDARMQDGGERFQAPGKTKHFIESQFAMRTGLFSLDRVLNQAREYLQNWTERTPDPWNSLGNLYCEPSLSRKSRARITKDGNADLGVAVLGLSFALSASFRLLTAGRPNQLRHVGDTMPTDGKPCWEIVADYLNCTFPSMSIESADSIRQRYHTFAKDRTVRIRNWTGAAVRQPQIREE
jgi:hypothetical protein